MTCPKCNGELKRVPVIYYEPFYRCVECGEHVKEKHVLESND